MLDLLLELFLAVLGTVGSTVLIATAITWWYRPYYIATGKWEKMKFQEEYTMSAFGLGVTTVCDFFLMKCIESTLPTVSSMGIVLFLSGAIFHFLLSDFMIFFVHYLFHKIPALRPYHLPWHHIFTEPTAVGFAANHPVENILLLLAIRTPVFFWPMPLSWIIFQSLFSHVWTMFGHANVPYDSNILYQWGIIGNQSHLVHHQRVRYNMGLFFTYWDQLFGTYYDHRQNKKSDATVPDSQCLSDLSTSQEQKTVQEEITEAIELEEVPKDTNQTTTINETDFTTVSETSIDDVVSESTTETSV